MNIQMNALMALASMTLYGAQLRWPWNHEKKLYVVMRCLKAWQHYLGTHKTKVYMNNVFL
jgi:hypothetical protein